MFGVGTSSTSGLWRVVVVVRRLVCASAEDNEFEVIKTCIEMPEGVGIMKSNFLNHQVEARPHLDRTYQSEVLRSAPHLVHKYPFAHG